MGMRVVYLSGIIRKVFEGMVENYLIAFGLGMIAGFPVGWAARGIRNAP